jgi:hypothetical protein
MINRTRNEMLKSNCVYNKLRWRTRIAFGLPKSLLLKIEKCFSDDKYRQEINIVIKLLIKQAKLLGFR